MKTEYQREGFELVLERYLGISNSPGSELLMPMDARVAFCGDGFLRIYTPKKVEWNGEGMPPVGAVCELRPSKLSEWHQAEIKFASRNVVVWDWVGEPSINGLCTAYAHAIEIRPIRTPEQIAAEERDREFEEIRTVMGMHDDYRDAAEDLLNRGYRKQVKP